MKRIQLGNDITIKWTITKNDDVSLNDTQVVLVDALKKNALFKYKIEDNVITGKFYGKDLRTLGIYSLVLVNNAGEKNMSTLVHPNVFNLVKKLDNKIACGEDDDNITTELLEFSSDITTGWSTDLSDYVTIDMLEEFKPKFTEELLEALNSGISADKIKELEDNAFSGDYNDLTNKPTIPSVEGLASESWVEGQNYLTLHLDITGKLDKSEAEELYQPKGEYLTEHQTLKTINGESLVGTSDIVIESGKPNITLTLNSQKNGFVLDSGFQKLGKVTDLNSVDLFVNIDGVIVEVFGKYKLNNAVIVAFYDGSSVLYKVTINSFTGAVSQQIMKTENVTQSNINGYLRNYAPTSALNGLLKESDLKTVNGESIVGSGDITVAGGESKPNFFIKLSPNGLEVIDDVELKEFIVFVEQGNLPSDANIWIVPTPEVYLLVTTATFANNPIMLQTTLGANSLAIYLSFSSGELTDSLIVESDLKETVNQTIDNKGFATKTYVDEAVANAGGGFTLDEADARYWMKDEAYNKTQLDALLDEITAMDADDYYTKIELDTKFGDIESILQTL